MTWWEWILVVMDRLKRTVLWVLGAAFTVLIYTDIGLLILAAVVVPILIAIGLKTPKVNDRAPRD
jgi:hypothetical protein